MPLNGVALVKLDDPVHGVREFYAVLRNGVIVAEFQTYEATVARDRRLPREAA